MQDGVWGDAQGDAAELGGVKGEGLGVFEGENESDDICKRGEKEKEEQAGQGAAAETGDVFGGEMVSVWVWGGEMGVVRVEKCVEKSDGGGATGENEKQEIMYAGGSVAT